MSDEVKAENYKKIMDLVSIKKFEMLYSINKNEWTTSLTEFHQYDAKDIFVAFRVI